MNQETLDAFTRLDTILNTLRRECPWDRVQTMDSLRYLTVEETYELCDALIKNDKPNICKELGDVLLHVLFYAKIGSETGDFDIGDVCQKLTDKLIFRHPHVFGEAAAANAEEVSKLWEQIKQKEKDGNKTVLSGVPSSLPALVKAYRIQDKARNVGFDWEQRDQVWQKVKEEISEFEAEVADMDKEKATAEFGDVMFSLINAARLYGINPDNALARTNQKFIRRFGYVEAKAKEQGCEIDSCNLAWELRYHVNNHDGGFQPQQRIDLLQDDDDPDATHEARQNRVGNIADVFPDFQETEKDLEKSA